MCDEVSYIYNAHFLAVKPGNETATRTDDETKETEPKHVPLRQLVVDLDMEETQPSIKLLLQERGVLIKSKCTFSKACSDTTPSGLFNLSRF